jgi:hypothetical protein
MNDMFLKQSRNNSSSGITYIIKPSIMKANYKYVYQYYKITKHALYMKVLCISKVK